MHCIFGPKPVNVRWAVIGKWGSVGFNLEAGILPWLQSSRNWEVGLHVMNNPGGINPFFQRLFSVHSGMALAVKVWFQHTRSERTMFGSISTHHSRLVVCLRFRFWMVGSVRWWVWWGFFVRAARMLCKSGPWLKGTSLQSPTAPTLESETTAIQP